MVAKENIDWYLIAVSGFKTFNPLDTLIPEDEITEIIHHIPNAPWSAAAANYDKHGIHMG